VLKTICNCWPVWDEFTAKPENIRFACATLRQRALFGVEQPTGRKHQGNDRGGSGKK